MTISQLLIRPYGQALPISLTANGMPPSLAMPLTQSMLLFVGLMSTAIPLGKLFWLYPPKITCYHQLIH